MKVRVILLCLIKLDDRYETTDIQQSAAREKVLLNHVYAKDLNYAFFPQAPRICSFEKS